MQYKAENIDTDKILNQIKFLRKFDEENKKAERIATEKYHEGFNKALDIVEEMFYCSNYEKKKIEK